MTAADVVVVGATAAGVCAAVAAQREGARTLLLEPGHHLDVAFSSIRMEPQFEMLGHAAGLAAAQACRRGTGLHDLDVGVLQDRLRDQGAVLSL